MAHAPGVIRDAIVGFLSEFEGDATSSEIHKAVVRRLGSTAQSSVRSYLNLNTPDTFERVSRGKYRLKQHVKIRSRKIEFKAPLHIDKAQLIHSDCFSWLEQQPPCSVHAVVTDPPYGLVEYTSKEQDKLRSGRGGIWRIPPSFDGHLRSPLPRFTILNDDDRERLYIFFRRLGVLLARVTVPGANIVIASNPLLSHIVASAMADSGLEIRGHIARLVMTMRGGDRPKNAHTEFSDVSVMPRSMWEPWVALRKPLDGRVQDNLRKWHTGGFKRLSATRPFGDVIKSSPTPASERKIADHPSLKPQAFLRQLVRASLPLGKGVVLDPFAGSGSTLAAANAVGYLSIGIETDAHYIKIATRAIPQLASISIDPI